MSVKQGGNTIAGGSATDQTFDGTSTNAQSGVAINGKLANYATTAAMTQAINAKIQLVTSLPTTRDPNVLYLLAES